MFFRSKPAVSWLVVFLGNPGAKYDGTRHNAGFMAADALASDKGIKIDRLKYKALTCRCKIGGQDVLLMKPQTFMNLSGDAVREAQAFFKIPTDHVLVVSDDVSLPCGKLRIRRDGSAGGHNGLKDIIAKCGGQNFPRIKMGVGAPADGHELIDWVLGSFYGEDKKLIEDAAKRAAQAVEAVITDGIDTAMGKFSS